MEMLDPPEYAGPVSERETRRNLTAAYALDPERTARKLCALFNGETVTVSLFHPGGPSATLRIQR